MRDEMIVDHGHGVRVYPSTTGEAPHVVNAQKRTCSSEYCQNLVGQCAHLWEDDFRFGPHANKAFILPPRTTRKRKDGEGWAAVERYIPRPNPDIDGRKFATVMKNARINMAQDSRVVLADVARYLRGEEAKKALFTGEKSRCGRPRADLYDVAMMAILRMGEAIPNDTAPRPDRRFVRLRQHRNRLGCHSIFRGRRSRDGDCSQNSTFVVA